LTADIIPIPPFVFQFTRPGKAEQDSALTEAMLFTVTTIPVDTTQAIKKSSSLWTSHFAFKEALPYIIGGLVIIVLVVLLIYSYPGKSIERAHLWKAYVPRDLHMKIALEELRKLEAEKILAVGRLKKISQRPFRYYTYVYRAMLRVKSMSQTTYEILYGFKGNNALMHCSGKSFKIYIQTADFVKVWLKHNLLQVKNNYAYKCLCFC